MVSRRQRNLEAEERNLLEKLEQEGFLPTIEEPDDATDKQLRDAHTAGMAQDLAAHLSKFSGYRILSPALQQHIQELYQQELGDNLHESFNANDFSEFNDKLTYLSRLSGFLERTESLRPTNYERAIRAYMVADNDDDLEYITALIAENAVKQVVQELREFPRAELKMIRRTMNRKITKAYGGIKQKERFRELAARLQNPEMQAYSRSSLEAVMQFLIAFSAVERIELGEDYAFDKTEKTQKEVLAEFKIDPYKTLEEMFGIRYHKHGGLSAGDVEIDALDIDTEEEFEEQLMRITNFVDYEIKLEKLIRRYYEEIDELRHNAIRSVGWLNSLLQANPRIEKVLSPYEFAPSIRPREDVKEKHRERAQAVYAKVDEAVRKATEIDDGIIRRIVKELLETTPGDVRKGEKIARYFDLVNMGEEEMEKALREYNNNTTAQMGALAVNQDTYFKGIPEITFSVASKRGMERITIRQGRKDLAKDVSMGYEVGDNEFTEEEIIEHLLDCATQFAGIYSENKRIGMAMHFAAVSEEGKPVLAIDTITLGSSAKRFSKDGLEKITDAMIDYIMGYAKQAGFNHVVIDGYNEESLANKYGSMIKGKEPQQTPIIRKIGPYVPANSLGLIDDKAPREETRVLDYIILA